MPSKKRIIITLKIVVGLIGALWLLFAVIFFVGLKSVKSLDAFSAEEEPAQQEVRIALEKVPVEKAPVTQKNKSQKPNEKKKDIDFTEEDLRDIRKKVSNEKIEKLRGFLDAQKFFTNIGEGYPDYSPCESVCDLRKSFKKEDQIEFSKVVGSDNIELIKDLFESDSDRFLENPVFSVKYLLIKDLEKVLPIDLLEFISSAFDSDNTFTDIYYAFKAPILMKKVVSLDNKINNHPGGYAAMMEEAMKPSMEYTRMMYQCAKTPNEREQIQEACFDLIHGEGERFF